MVHKTEFMFRKVSFLFITFIGLASLALLWNVHISSKQLQVEEPLEQQELEEMSEVKSDWMILESLGRMISGAAHR